MNPAYIFYGLAAVALVIVVILIRRKNKRKAEHPVPEKKAEVINIAPPPPPPPVPTAITSTGTVIRHARSSGTQYLAIEVPSNEPGKPASFIALAENRGFIMLPLARVGDSVTFSYKVDAAGFVVLEAFAINFQTQPSKPGLHLVRKEE
jgi:hypothetical protein